MIPIADNPAVSNPRAALTSAEKEALCAIGFFKRQWTAGGKVKVGNKSFAITTIEGLKRKELLRGQVPSLAPTVAGQLALSKLRGDR